jgi:hypothetical protein
MLEALESSFAGSAPMCSWCAFEPYCGADPVFHHATQSDFVGKKPLSAFCNRNMSVFKGLTDGRVIGINTSTYQPDGKDTGATAIGLAEPRRA